MSDSAQNTGQTNHVSIQETASSFAQTALSSNALNLGLYLSLSPLPELNTNGGSRGHDDDQVHTTDEVTIKPESEHAYWHQSLTQRGYHALETIIVYKNLISVIGASNLIKWNANSKRSYLTRHEVNDRENNLVTESLDLVDLYKSLNLEGSHIINGAGKFYRTTDEAISSIQKKKKGEIFFCTAFPLVKQSIAMRYSGQFNLVKDDLNRDNVMELEQK